MCINTQDNKCSTPFGIKDQITVPARRIERMIPSAQRLSASKIKSPAEYIRYYPGPGKCSTPFGIKDQITQLYYFQYHYLFVVLNAFRHQRSNHGIKTRWPWSSYMCSTPFGIKDQITWILPKNFLRCIISAQRLSASKIKSPFYFLHFTFCKSSCSTPFGIKDQITAPWLNVRRNCPRCSTPFGIKDQITHHLGGITGHLNSCSTPFGIKDQITASMRRNLLN